MSKDSFELTPVEEKPGRIFRRRSKYGPIIDSFLGSKESLVAVTVEGREANYVRMQLKKLIDERGLGNVSVSVVNNMVYLEK